LGQALNIVLGLPCGLIPGLFVSLRYLLAIPVTFSALVSDSLYPFASRPIAMLLFLSHDELLEEGDSVQIRL
jgi:hypothetical protein